MPAAGSGALLDARIGLSGIWCAYATILAVLLMLHGSYYLLVWRRRGVRTPM
jgi:hypothetical protein